MGGLTVTLGADITALKRARFRSKWGYQNPAFDLEIAGMSSKLDSRKG